MTVQVLVATMNQKDYSLLEKMNISTDAIVGNQCDRNEIVEFEYGNNKVKWLSFAEKGVGLNRNNALMRATGDIVLFADDDMIYTDSYSETVKKAFRDLPDADVIVFDLEYPHGGRRPISKIQKLSKKDCMRFGTARLAVRLSQIHLNGISFNLSFGGGARYSSGEDTLFLVDCLNKKLNIYSYPVVIARLQDERESTWFHGYDDKFFFDKGVLYYMIDRNYGCLYAAYHCLKHHKRYSTYGWVNAYKQMVQGFYFAKKHEWIKE